MVVLVPVPVDVIAPGDLIKVQVPVAGNPLKTTLPVAVEQVGCMIIPTTGAEGAEEGAMITILAEATEVHEEAFVTV
jgi:hypothetical protein